MASLPELMWQQHQRRQQMAELLSRGGMDRPGVMGVAPVAAVDPLNEALAGYWRGLTGRGQGSGWFGMNTVGQELNRLGDIRRQSGGLNPEYGAALFDSPLAPGFGVMATVDDVGKAAGNVVEGITAYHGSPHTFDRFDMSKIGTGEGAQAYGHGLYFAESEDVARQYRDNLSRQVAVDGGAWSKHPSDSLQATAESGVIGRVSEGIDPAEAIAREAASWREQAAFYRAQIAENPDLTEQLRAEADQFDQIAAITEGLNPTSFVKNPGSMYEVRINANPDDFLDWDKPLSEQSEAVRDRIAQSPAAFMLESPNIADRSVASNYYDMMEHARLGRFGEQYAGERGDYSLAAKFLKDNGLPGIKYLDAGSRGAGDGTRNYVVFDDKLIEILRRYGLLPPLATGGAALLGGGEAEAGQ